MKITRKDFLRTGLAAAGAVMGVSGVACGGDDDDGGGGGGGNGSCSSDITPSHGHTLAVSAADISAGVDKTYEITGSADHGHTAIVTAADFADLKGGKPVSITSSSTAGHNHSITVTCS